MRSFAIEDPGSPDPPLYATLIVTASLALRRPGHPPLPHDDPSIFPSDARLVLVRDRTGLPQHLHRRRRALQPAAVAHRVPL